MASKPPFAGEKVKVSEVFDLQMGKTPSRKNLSYWNNGDYDWVSIKDLGSYDRFVGRTKETISELGRVESGIKPVPANTLLMSFKLSIGKTAITTRETYTNEAIMAFLDRGYYDFDLGYMWHQFRSKDWMAGTNVAVMGKTLNKQTLGNAIINLPAMSDQLTIARQLDEVHALTDLTKNRLGMLDQLIKSRFVEMFGNQKDNELNLPIIKLGEESFVGSSKRVFKNELLEEGIPFLRGTEVGAFGLGKRLKPSLFISEEHYKRLVAHSGKPELGDLLLPSICPDGQIWEVDTDDPFYFKDGRVLWIRPNREVLNSTYLKFALKNRFEDDFQSVASGTTFAELKIINLKNMSLVMPELETQKQFSNFVTLVDKSRFVVQQQIDKLQTLYDSLAQEYFGD